MKIELLNFKVMGDERGSLISLEQHSNIPFEVKRVYYIFGTKEDVNRGLHAHRNLKQVLIAVSGTCNILTDNGNNTETYLLNNPQTGLLIEGLVWREMYNFSSDCVLLVLASDYYDESDYIRDYNEFLEVVR
jgi:dTDP-4-dehydrorhamnose 3,5-epimerase-like enzyme